MSATGGYAWMHVCLHTSKSICMDVCMSMYVLIRSCTLYAFMHICMCVCADVCVHAFMYECLYVHKVCSREYMQVT